MSLKKFGPRDILRNTMRAYPRFDFFIYDGKIFYNNKPSLAGQFTNSTDGPTNVGPGHISLYEYNIDKLSGSSIDGVPYSGSGQTSATTAYNNYIYPFVVKGSSGASFRSATSSAEQSEWTMAAVGTEMVGFYPMSASISRQFLSEKAGHRIAYWDMSENGPEAPDLGEIQQDDDGNVRYIAPRYPHYWALKNKLDFYASRSEHYKLTGSFNEVADSFEWIKDQQVMGMVSIPSIFYGTKIKPGSVSLKWYFTGSLCGELQDNKQNGELIQVSGGVHATSYNDKVAGIVLYDEGVILLTGSWNLQPETIPLRSGSTTAYNPSWIYFAAGAQDGVSQPTTAVNAPANPAGSSALVSASFNMSFQGMTDTQVLTMFAHAKRGQANYSNNPTYIRYGQDKIKLSSSHVYEENPDQLIVNIASSSFSNHSASFERKVYISRVGIYDKNKNLIGVATLSDPILKEEDQDLTFKLKLDI